MAAARFILQRRFGSVLGLERTRFIHPLFSTGIKLINTKTNPLQNESKNDPKYLEPTDSKTIEKETKVSYTALSSLKSSKRHDMAMIFTCRVCEARSVKTTCRESYEKGVVVARCPGCENLHLIADRLGWFGQPGSVEDFLAQRGEEVKKGSADTMNFTLEDLAGSNKAS